MNENECFILIKTMQERCYRTFRASKSQMTLHMYRVLKEAKEETINFFKKYISDIFHSLRIHKYVYYIVESPLIFFTYTFDLNHSLRAQHKLHILYQKTIIWVKNKGRQCLKMNLEFSKNFAKRFPMTLTFDIDNLIYGNNTLLTHRQSFCIVKKRFGK